jgi:type VI secretion system protein ImpE
VTADALLQAGRLEEAIVALGAELRERPSDARRRTFLFELLCFAGAFERAERQLDALAGAGPEQARGVLFYRAALQAERARQRRFADGELPPAQGAAPPVAATLNGRAVTDLQDADPRVGARLEVFAGDQYLWLPLAQVESIRLEPPRRLRDLLWAPARLRTTAADMGEVLLPVLTPLAWEAPDEELRLGRATAWGELADGTLVPVGQKLFRADDEEIPLLELREVVVLAPAAAA